jgi:hypothetical protein
MRGHLLLDYRELKRSVKAKLSIVVLGISCVLAGLFTVFLILRLPYAILKESEGWNSWAFRMFFGPLLASVVLVLGVIPSALLYWKGRSRLDRTSLVISSCLLCAIALIWLTVEPARRWFIFGINPFLG